jgi:hypothetical protein
MARYEITSPDGRRFEVNAPDDATQEQVIAYAQQQFSSQPSAPISDVPSPVQDRQVADYYANRQKEASPSMSIGDFIEGVGGASGTMITGATTGMLGRGAGFIAQAGRELMTGQYGTPEAANRIEDYSNRVGESLTNTPETEAAKLFLQKIGEGSEKLGLSSLPPVLGGMAGNINTAAQATKIGAPAIGHMALDEAAIAKAKSPLSIAASQESKIQSAASSAIKNGMDERFVDELTKLNPVERKRAAEMVSAIERGDNDYMASRYDRHTSVVGQALAERIKSAKSENKKAGIEVDKAVQTLPEVIDPSAPISTFSEGIKKLDIRLDDDNVPIFKKSAVEGFSADKKVISNVAGRIREAKTAKDLHYLKKYIYDNVHYGKKREGGLRPSTEVFLKDVARDINNTLGDASDSYKSANSAYSETAEALGDLQKSLGTIDIYGEGSDKALGIRLGALLSKQQRVADMENAIKNIDSVTQKYGAQFSDDIFKLVAISDDLESFYGVRPKTSLGGNLDKQAAELIDRGVTRTALDKGISLLSKSDKKKRQESLQALKTILQSENK